MREHPFHRPVQLRAYRATEYEAKGAVARIGHRSPEIERLLAGRAGAFVTAWNPYSQRRPDGWNRRMNRALAQRLRSTPHWPGLGQGRGWREEHFLVRADSRRVMVLARRFRQRAIVLVTPPHPPRLVFLAHACLR